MRPLRLLVAGALAGCARVEHTHEVELPAPQVRRVFGDLVRGAVGYVGFPATDTVSLAVRTWGEGGSRAQAERREASSSWGAEVRGELLDLWARSPEPHAGVDVAVFGPRRVDATLVAREGVVELRDVRGAAELTGSVVSVSGHEGDLDVLATDGPVDVEAFPSPGDALRLETRRGDVVLALPLGAPVSLRVDADPAFGVSVTDLGFDTFDAGPGHVDADAGDGSIRVDVRVRGGAFLLWEAVAPLATPTDGESP